MAEIQQTYPEALDALSKVADANGNCFRLKLVRRPNAASSTSIHVGTFAEATWQHIADAESWIAPFCGGGLYILQIFDGKDARKQYGMITPSEIAGSPRQPNPKVCQNAGWTGPVLVTAGGDATNGAGAVATSPFTLAGESPFTSGNAPRTPADVAGLSSLFSAQRAEITRKEEELREREHRAEVEAIRREAKERADRLDQRIADLIATKKEDKPAIDVGQLVTGILTAAAPLVAAFVQISAEGRKAQLEIEKAKLERNSEDRKRDAEERRAADERQIAAAGRPLIDPQVLDLFKSSMDQSRGQAVEFAALMKAQAEGSKSNMESQAIAQRSMLQTIADIAQLQLKTQGGGEESPGVDWGKVIQGLMGGLAMMANMKNGAPGQGNPAPGTMVPAGQIGAAGTNGAAPPAAPLPEVPESEALNAIEKRIRAKEPPDQIVESLKKILAEDKTAQAEVAAEGGLLETFEARLEDFAEDEKNGKYVEALVAAVQKSGIGVPATAPAGAA